MALRSINVVFVAAVLFLAACNSSDQSKDTTGNTGDTSSTAPPETPPAPASTIINTPQYMLMVRHKVKDYGKWQMAYDAHDTARVAAGIHSYVVGRGVQDSNTVFIVMKVDDTARANVFGKSPSLKSVMQNAGVVGTPMMNLMMITMQDTGKISSELRSVVSFTVKDWSVWQQNFESGAQSRTDNGVAVRGYGHDAMDDHKVKVVTALMDSAKAVAYFKSDTLKKRMQASGVTGQPDRFLFRVVRRY
jgi:hypothetical protein